jgi:hypothetical protein
MSDQNVNILEAVQKAIQASGLTNPGGLLNPKQQEEFFRYLRSTDRPLLSKVRFHQMKQRQEDIDKIYLGAPITKGHTEASLVPYDQKTLFGGTVRLNTTKYMSSWYVTHEVLRDNIELEKLQVTVMEMMSSRAAEDFELAAVRGDESSTDPLYSVNDGWAKLTESAQVYSAGGAEISREHFNIAFRRLPDMYKGRPGLSWLMNPNLMAEWRERLQDRIGPVGDDALRGASINPLGIPVIEAYAIPRDLDVVVQTATPAELRGTKFGPFNVSSSAKNLKLDVDNAGAVTVDLSTSPDLNGLGKGPLETREVARMINVAVGKAVAFDDGEGRLLLRSTTTGSSSELDIQAPASASAWDLLGVSLGVVNGGATSGTRRSGTFFWLTYPQNFIYGVLGQTRVSSVYWQDNDYIKVVMFNEVDFQVENKDAVVKVKDIFLND